MFAKAQNGAPSCMDAVYIPERDPTEIHHLLLFDDTGNVVNEEYQEAGPI